MVGVLLAVGAAAACGYVATSPSAPTTTPAPPTPGTTSAGTGSPAATPIVIPRQDVAAAGSDGLTVRYVDRDGSAKTLPVEDFRR